MLDSLFFPRFQKDLKLGHIGPTMGPTRPNTKTTWTQHTPNMRPTKAQLNTCGFLHRISVANSLVRAVVTAKQPEHCLIWYSTSTPPLVETCHNHLHWLGTTVTTIGEAFPPSDSASSFASGLRSRCHPPAIQQGP